MDRYNIERDGEIWRETYGERRERGRDRQRDGDRYIDTEREPRRGTERERQRETERYILFFLWFPLCRGEADLLVTAKYGYFRNLLPLVHVVALFSPFFFLLCLSQISLYTVPPS